MDSKVIHPRDLVAGNVKSIFTECRPRQQPVLSVLFQRLREIPAWGIPYEEEYESGFEDMLRRQSDTGKLKGLLGWASTYDIDGIIVSVVAAFRQAQG